MAKRAGIPTDLIQALGEHESRAREVMARNDGRDWFRIVNHAADANVAADTTVVYIYDEIGYWGTDASTFVQELQAIDTPKIEVHINSPGGAVFDGLAIYTALKAHSAEITTVVDALAASAASFIAQAGDVRKMTRNATMMIHEARGVTYGHAEDHRSMAEVLDRLSNSVADIYNAQAGGTLDDWRQAMRDESWYNAQEAVGAGLADEILDYSNPDAEEATNKWDLGVFNFKGREAAPTPAMPPASTTPAAPTVAARHSDPASVLAELELLQLEADAELVEL